MLQKALTDAATTLYGFVYGHAVAYDDRGVGCGLVRSLEKTVAMSADGSTTLMIGKGSLGNECRV